MHDCKPCPTVTEECAEETYTIFTAKAASNATPTKIENTGVAAASKENISTHANMISDGEVDDELQARGATDVEMNKTREESFDVARDQEDSPM